MYSMARCAAKKSNTQKNSNNDNIIETKTIDFYTFKTQEKKKHKQAKSR